MDTSNRILNCDATSLLDLKAELYRKQETCKLAKAHQNAGPLKRMTIKGQDIASKKKDKKVPETTEVPKDNYEDEIFQKSRIMLEAKAKMYDQIVKKQVAIDEEFSDNYLVDFQRKALFEHSADVTRSDSKPDHAADPCDLEMDAVHSQDLTSTDRPKSPIATSLSHHSLDSVSQNSASGKSVTEKTETSGHQDSEGPIHYQNVRFNEIRDHGVGYFAFSEEEKQRKEQMDLLKNLRQETIESKQANKKLKQKKQSLLQSRLAKVCQRRNIDSSVIEVYAKKDETPEQIEPEQISNSSADQPNSNEPNCDPGPPKKVRPWDIGKSDFDFPKQTSKRKSGAEKWIENKREERNEEFAPPSFYFTGPESKAKKFHQDH